MRQGNLLDERAVEDSPIVANSRMNRERELTGTNSYTRELRLHPLEWLQKRIADKRQVSWLDLCCGTGRALGQAAECIERAGHAEHVRILGVDLVDMFQPGYSGRDLELRAASLHDWESSEQFDLITCVHGLHYIGDKLGLIERAAGWLKSDGLFLGHLDLKNLRKGDGTTLASVIGREFRKWGIKYNRSSRLLRIEGDRVIRFSYRFCGADDNAGPNFTRQAAVDSCYELCSF